MSGSSGPTFTHPEQGTLTFLSSLVLPLCVPVVAAAVILLRRPARLRRDGTGWGGMEWEGKEALGQWLNPPPDGLFAAPLLLGSIYNPQLASERRLSLAGLLFPHEGSSPEVCGHQSKLTGHCFFSMTTAAPPNGDRCPASDAGLWRDPLFGKKGGKMGALGAACTAPRSICTDSQGGTQ